MNGRDPPTPASRLTEAESWLDKLPAPPKPLYGQDEISIAAWLRDVAEAGGIEGLQWAYAPENFPFGPIMRGRVQHIFGIIFRELEDRTKHQAERAAIERRAKDAAAARDLRRNKGWAP